MSWHLKTCVPQNTPPPFHRPTSQQSFARSAIQAAPSPITLVLVKGENTSVDVKRLVKKSAPPRFGRRLSATEKERATHICLDCGENAVQRDAGETRGTGGDPGGWGGGSLKLSVCSY